MLGPHWASRLSGPRVARNARLPARAVAARRGAALGRLRARGLAGYDLLMKRGVGALVVAILLTGCGGQSSSAQRATNALEAKIATQYETAATPYNHYLDKATKQYIALVRRYADQLGPKEARRRLTAESDEVSSFCPPCAGEMLDAARRY